MIKREKAIKSIANRQIYAPELRRLLDYEVGDIVQIKADGKKHAGEIGVITGIRVINYDKDNKADLAYTIKLSDREAVEVSAHRMRFLRHSDDAITPTEKGEI